MQQSNSILPEIFRHRSNKVRIYHPLNILIDFHGTISERKWEDRVIFPYVRRAIPSFIREKITSESVQKCISGLRNESFEQRFRYKYDEAPVIDDSSPSADSVDLSQLSGQVSDFLLWQIHMRKETRETQIIQRLVWIDGFRQRHIETPIYEDVFECVRRWHDVNNCRIYIISSLDSETLKLLLENTNKGNLSQYIDGYVSASKCGDKMQPETYKLFYERCLAGASEVCKECPSTGGRAAKRSSSSRSPPASANHKSRPQSASSSNSSLSSMSSELYRRMVLFLTDSGQEAKAASQVADGSAFECLLVNRPGNKRFRTYYLSQFGYIDRFDEIEFVS